MPGEIYTPLEMSQRLIAFDTVSSKSNLALIDFVEDYLQGHGLRSKRTWNDEKTKANLVVSIGPEIAGGVVLSGHSDVVPTEHQTWTTPPFEPRVEAGRLYGRGSADMKSFLATCLALAPEFKATDLKVPIHIAISYDEESGMMGVKRLITDAADWLQTPRAVIVGEPTGMRIVQAHKGITCFRTIVTGREAHSSQPHRAGNALIAAGELIAFLGRLAEERRAAAPAESPFDPPYTTFNIGMIESGHAINIVPGRAVIDWEFRPIPGEDTAALRERFERFAQEEVLPRLARHAPEARIETLVDCDVVPLRPEGAESPAETLVRHLTGQNSSSVVSYATEGGWFQEAGWSTVICGPGSIDQAHQPDEFIEVAQIDACATFLRRLKDWAADAA